MLHRGPVAVEDGRMVQRPRQVHGGQGERNHADPEQRIDRGEALPPRALVDRVAQHEVRAVEEEHEQERVQLLVAPVPPDAPRDLRPDRARDQHERAEDHALVDRDVGAQVVHRIPAHEVASRIERADQEEQVGRQRDRHVQVEDALPVTLGAIARDPQRDQQRGEDEEAPGGEHRRA
jgi:hypothetical protein